MLQELDSSDVKMTTDLLSATGAFGKVYLGLFDNRQVAVKTFPITSEEKFFLSEVLVAEKSLRLPFVLQAIGYVHKPDLRCIVMPLQQYSLQDALDKYDQFPMIGRLEACRDLVNGLINLHAVGVVHYDIKPENILYDGRCWNVGDFGLARVHQLMENSLKVSRRPSRTGSGSQGYCAPEVESLGHMSACADVYSAGVVLLVCVTGYPAIHELAHVTDFLQEEIEEAKSVHAVTLSALWQEDINPTLLALVDLGLKCCSKKTRKEPTRISLCDVAATLQQLLVDMTVITNKRTVPANIIERSIAVDGTTAADDIGPRTAAAAVIDSALQPASVTAIDSTLDLQLSGTITNSLTTTSTPTRSTVLDTMGATGCTGVTGATGKSAPITVDPTKLMLGANPLDNTQSERDSSLPVVFGGSAAGNLCVSGENTHSYTHSDAHSPIPAPSSAASALNLSPANPSPVAPSPANSMSLPRPAISSANPELLSWTQPQFADEWRALNFSVNSGSKELSPSAPRADGLHNPDPSLGARAFADPSRLQRERERERGN